MVTRGPKTINPIRPNQGIEAAYRRALESVIEEMNRSILWFVKAAYRRDEPLALAQDRSPSDRLNTIVKRLSLRWQRRFNDIAPTLSSQFAEKAAKRSDDALRAALKKGGMTVNFKMTREANDALNAVVAENVSLIRSIASEHFTAIQGIVMRAASVGRDMSFMSDELEKQFGVTKRRAALISRDQNNKATAVIVKTRQQEIGATQAVWKHSTAGKHPRPSHVAASGKLYDIEKGMFLDGKWVWPGTEINCRCVCKTVIPGLD